MADLIWFCSRESSSKSLESREGYAYWVERREAAEQAAGYGLPATGEGRAGGQGSVVSDHPSSISEPPSTESVRHERPKRFVYGKGKRD